MLFFHLTDSIFPAAVIAFTLRDWVKIIAARGYERKGDSRFTFCNGAHTEEPTSVVLSLQDTLWATCNECCLSAPSSYYILISWPVQSSNSFAELCFPERPEGQTGELIIRRKSLVLSPGIQRTSSFWKPLSWDSFASLCHYFPCPQVCLKNFFTRIGYYDPKGFAPFF